MDDEPDRKAELLKRISASVPHPEPTVPLVPLDSPNPIESIEPTAVSPDLELNAIATGCGVSCLSGCVTAPILFACLATAGVSIQQVSASGASAIPVWIGWLGFLIAQIVNIAIGYYTARASKNVPKLNVVIVGVIMLLFGVFDFATLPAFRTLSDYMGWILTIPLMLYGASLAERAAC